jgi:hypothetical protein
MLRGFFIVPYCLAQSVIVSIPMKSTGRFLMFNERNTKWEDKNEEARYAVSNAR